jgi:UDP-2-acetamido-3-amino-2,3-dideoxy-glucuronate N-acetyltransferase
MSIHPTASIHPSSVIDEGAVIGAGTRIWHFSHAMPNAKVGENCRIGQNVFIASNVIIGDGCKIQNNVSLYEGVTLENDVFCGPSMVFTNVNKPRAGYPVTSPDEYLKTLVKRGATIGANATIVCGVTIGEHSFIGAGAVVTKSVPAYAVITGVPGRITGWMSAAGENLDFTKSNYATDTTGANYRKINDKKVERLL